MVKESIKKPEFKGTVASAPSKKIKGVAKIILEEKDFPKLKKGEILVTDETDATFLPIIRKAKAFITDTGGLLCHAAITARELKKVCITGTKIATQILKDGDLVEIDAEKGIVRTIPQL